MLQLDVFVRQLNYLTYICVKEIKHGTIKNRII